MSIITRFLQKRIDAAVAQRLKQVNLPPIQMVNNALVLASDNRVAYIQDGYGGTATVFAIVQFQARKAASVPGYLYEVKDSKALERYKCLTNGLNEKTLFEAEKWRAKALREVSGHPVLDLLNDPNPSQSSAEFKEQMIGFMKLTGAGLCSKLRLSSGKIQELNILPSHYITLKTASGGGMVKILQYVLNQGTRVEYDAEDVIHIRYPDYDWKYDGSHLMGMSPLRAGRNTMRRSNDAEKSSMKKLQNSGAEGMIVPKEHIQELTEDQVDLVEDRLNSKVNGMNNRGNIAIGQVPLDYLKFGLTAVELDILNTERYTDEKLCQIFGHRIELLSSVGSAMNNREQAIKQVITQTIYPDLNIFYEAINRFLLPEYKVDTKKMFMQADITALPEMQKDIKEMVDSLRDAYWITPNEKRIAMKYDEFSEEYANTLLVPTGLTPINDLGLSDSLMEEDNMMEDE